VPACSTSAPVSDGGSPIANCRIYRSETSGLESFLVQVGNVLSYSDTSVTSGATYSYKVSARNAVGEGPLSDEASATAR
jgi:hypothetical protein